ncbi:hypothetical protein [Altericroceibacterium xinjiangense]|uniref:hypothetical protein n=1 Tax=Altericroceibacterium xinjiangense TaxID=762261 RepID=UPI0013DFF2E3|nr:hypothetical protein [Altericroceibacterium xinjiangense]
MKKPVVISIVACAMLAACESEPQVVAVEGVEQSEVDYSVADNQDELSRWDVDADGQLSQTEYGSVGSLAGHAWNTDDNPGLGPEEFASGWTRVGWTNPQAAFAAFDDDGDGILQAAELFDQEEWTEWDTDSSGKLEFGEFSYYAQ